MKKIIVLLLCLTSILSACNNSEQASKPNGAGVINIERKYDISDMEVSPDGRIYLADKEEIQVFEKSGKALNTIKESIKFCRSISIDENKLYALDETAKTIKAFELDGKLIKEYSLDTAGCIDMLCIGKDILLLKKYDDAKKVDLLLYDMEDGRLKKLETGKFIGFSRYKGNSVLLYETSANTVTNVIEYDYVKGKRLKEYSWFNRVITGICYDQRDDKVYITSGSEVLKIGLQDESMEALTVPDSKDSVLSDISTTEDICYILDSYNLRIHLANRDTKEENGENSITILTGFDLISDSMTPFAYVSEGLKTKYPECNIKYSYMTDTSKIKTKLMAGDSDFDIFTANQADIGHYMRNGVMQELNGYPSIKDSFKNLFDGLEDKCSYKGKLLGVPFGIQVLGYVVNDRLAKKIGVSVPKGRWTWEDFYKLAKDARKDINGDGIKDTYIIALDPTRKEAPLFLEFLECAYIDTLERKVEIDRNEFIELLNIWKKLWDEDLILGDQNGMFSEDSRVLMHMGGISLASGDQHLAYLPGLKTSNTYPLLDINFLCINRNSKNKELASEYLAQLLSREVQTAKGSIPSISNYKDISLYKELYEGTKLANKENYSMYADILKNSKMELSNQDLRGHEISVVERFMNGSISAEEAVRDIEEKAKMIIEE